MAVIVADGPELRRAEERQKTTLSLLGDSVQLGALSGSRLNELEQLGALFFGKKDEAAAKPLTPTADVYLVLNCSTTELVEVEKWMQTSVPPGATVVAYNLEVRLYLFALFWMLWVVGELTPHDPIACLLRSLRLRAATWGCLASRARSFTTASCPASSRRSSCGSAATARR